VFLADAPPVEFLASIRSYPGGLLEGSLREFVDLCDRHPRSRVAKGTSADLARNLAAASHRARVEVRRKCMAIGANMLLTATFRENVCDVQKAWAIWEDFIRLVRKRYRDFQYVVVAERQKRGAIHFHAGVVGWWDGLMLTYVRVCWLRASSLAGGGVHVRWKHAAMSAGQRNSGVAAYLSKYISKDAGGEAVRSLNEHRYRCSLGIVITKVDRMCEARTLDEAGAALLALMGEYGDPARYLYRSSLDSAVPVHWWACNWGRNRLGIPFLENRS
jgi:hypothetical protein